MCATFEVPQSFFVSLKTISFNFWTVISPSGELIAAGGMDNKCALFRVREGEGDRDKGGR